MREVSYRASVSKTFVVWSHVACMLVAFLVGKTTRTVLLEKPRRDLLKRLQQSVESNHHHHRNLLPPPVARGRVPRTVYTSKNFDTARTATSSSLLIRQQQQQQQQKEEEQHDQTTCLDSSPPNTETRQEQERQEQEETFESDNAEHLPAGQHLLVDLKGVDSSFLNSEQRLAYAMMEVVNEASLTLLSYHCHRMVPWGVSCVGVLLESHISFHTWPTERVITLDLFTCGSNPLLPVLPSIQRLFGVPPQPQPQQGTHHHNNNNHHKKEPTMVWSHKLRGFRPKDRRNALQQFDLGHGFLGLMVLEYKKEVASVETEFQRIDIYDAMDFRDKSFDDYQRSLSNDGSYPSRHPELYLPDRLVFLDGVMQSRRSGETVYHEALVHPAMFVHPHPRLVGIVGGGEGATLREVLKHQTVQTAHLIEIDEEMVRVSREYLPQWSDCRDLVGSSTWCMDDPRTQMHIANAHDWFVGRYSPNNHHNHHNNETTKEQDEEPLDVIIMDALDPDADFDLRDALYSDGRFLRSLYDALSEDGVLVVQIGRSPANGEPAGTMGPGRYRTSLIEQLERLGFKSMHIYHEAHGGMFHPWNYLVATKSTRGRREWYKNEAEFSLDIRKRIVRTKSGSVPLTYFDGATMVSYQNPSKRVENVYCRRSPMPNDCKHMRGFDALTPNAKADLFEVKQSGAGQQAGRGVYATADIVKGTFSAIEKAVQAVHFPSRTFDLITSLNTHFVDSLYSIEMYMHGYGFQNVNKGGREVSVDSSLMTFVNHGCNRTYNLGVDSGDITEFTADLTQLPDVFNDAIRDGNVFHPARDRNLRHVLVGADRFLRDIHAGEEILDNYLAFTGDKSDWEYDVLHLRGQCRGAAVGDISEYESES